MNKAKKFKADILRCRGLTFAELGMMVEVEKDLRSKFVGIADIVDVVRDMKVKG
jgi:hypothetical protein